MHAAPTKLGRYHLRYRIAVGGMGGVYLARATGAGGIDKVVAVKLMHEHMAQDDAVVKMFLDEARIASALNHVNVCATFDFGEHEGTYYLVMEYLEGEPLNRVLKALEQGSKRHPQHPWLVAHMLADAAEGLHAAHQLTGSDGKPLNVVHRDVTPHNLFVTYDGVAKVVDFGIARARERSASTEAGAFKGKLEYAAPEQIAGEAVDRRTDVWGLGVCLHELLTGRRLFHRDDYAATARAVMSEPIPPPSSLLTLPRGFDAICARALQRDPELRYPTAREFGRALRDLLAASRQVIDNPAVGEWLETQFPGDHAKRQALSIAVRQSGPDSPLEPVPAEYKVTAAGTGSNHPTTVRSVAPAGASIAALPPAADTPTRPARAREARRLVAVIALFALVGVGLAGLFAARTTGGGEPLPVPQPPQPSPPAPPPPAPLVVVEPPPAAPAPAPVPAPADPGPAGGTEVAFVPVDAPVDPTLAPSDQAEDAGVKEKRPTRRRTGVTTRGPTAPEPERAAQAEPVRAPAGQRLVGRGTVRFKTPGGTADVFVDGRREGTTPLTLELGPGTHTFELKVKGVEFGGPQQLKVSAGSDYDVEVDLR